MRLIVAFSILISLSTTSGSESTEVEPERGFDFDQSGEGHTVAIPLASNATQTDSLAKCNLKPDPGNGELKINRFYYNPLNQSCLEFEYKGQGGNDNSFSNELDCLTDCYSEVKDGPILKEEDVTIIDSYSVRDVESCNLPKDSGAGNDKLQRFYYDSDYNSCFAFKYLGSKGNANRFETRQDCEDKCLRMDGSVCKIEAPVEAIKYGQDCRDTQCPEGFSCFQGAQNTECCNSTVQANVMLMFDEKCPNGGKALGDFANEFFHVTLAKTCSDLICDKTSECLQLASNVAKCCPVAKQSFDQPLTGLADIVKAPVRKRTPPSSRFFAVPPPIGRDFCGLSLERGNCSHSQQKYYFVAEWQSCFAFKYSGCGGNENRFESREECENACLVADESVCRGPQTPAAPRGNSKDCSKAKCPEGYQCFQGLQQAECCEMTVQRDFQNLYNERCPNGQPAQGVFKDYFVALFGESCTELVCDQGYECMQISKYGAKCCRKQINIKGVKAVVEHDGVVKRNVEVCPAIERRLVKSCSQLFTDVEVVRKIWQAPRIISAEGIIQHLNIMCNKYEEYKNCLTMMTSNAACLDPDQSRKEQIFGFICQKTVREAIVSTENQRCLRRISKIEKIRNCEDDLEKGLLNNVFDKYSVCDAFDQTLQCSAAELLKCGPNTFSLMKNIITTLKSNIKECVNMTDTLDRIENDEESEEESEEEEETQEEEASTTVTVTTEAPTTTIAPTTTTRKSKVKKDRRCPREFVEKAESCTYLIGFRKIREIFGLKTDFVLANFEITNINEYCDHSKSYRKCMELSLSNDERCLHLLTEDPFYSFVVAFEDRLCEEDKQLKWLINSGCLQDVLRIPTAQKCLNGMDNVDERLLCKATQQLEGCIFNDLKSTCRLQEVQFFNEIMDMLRHRHRFCQPLGNSRSWRNRIGQRAVQFDDNQLPLPLTKQGCRNSRKLAMFALNGFVPECDENGNYRFMQCEKSSGSCWCVDVNSGLPLRGTHAPPGKPLPMCGLNYLFTCDKLEAKRCEMPNEQPQMTERWYREGDQCVQYLHSYCPSTAHLPPMPIRTQSACKSFCLPTSG